MNWQEVCDDPILQNLPYKLELNRYGEVVMNAVRMEHSFYVEKILLLLKEFLPEGYCPPELAVETEDGVRPLMLLGFLANELWQVEVPCMLQWLQRFASK